MPLVNPMQSIDMMHRSVLIPTRPMRIVSLVPSITETLHELGLEERVIGITKFCIHPKKWFLTKPKIGGTKNVNMKVIDELAPDLIIANKEENSQKDIALLIKKYPVWISDISNFDEGLHAIELLGEICNAEKDAKKILYRIHKAWSEFEAIKQDSKLCMYFIWDDPMMCAGSDSYIGDMILRLGLENCLEGLRYPVLGSSDLAKYKPDYIFLSSEPFPFKKEQLKKYQSLFPEAKVVLVNGEAFSWYGIRMRYTPSYFKKLIARLNN